MTQQSIQTNTVLSSHYLTVASMFMVCSDTEYKYHRKRTLKCMVIDI